MTHDIIPARLAIEAMRDSGYRDAAHALAELVDNAVQAGATDIEVLCLDKVEFAGQRNRRRVDRVAVLDNGSGMSKEVLQMALQFGNGTHLDPDSQDGIGKFGMGLPNSSISQCQRVDVWTWQQGQVLHSYLDVDEIRSGKLSTVPDPRPDRIPKDIRALAQQQLGECGTLVVWSRLDRVRWKSSRALLENSEFVIGRMYRYFLAEGKTTVRLAAFSPAASDGKMECDFDKNVLPNDPLYLMTGTSCPQLPVPHSHETLFEEYGPPEEIEVRLPGRKRPAVVRIKYSIVRQPVRKLLGEKYSNPGASPQGQHAARNIGISLVRAGRELELSHAHVIGYDPVERWWGIEVSFPPPLDHLFGVTNNKQSATGFVEFDLDEDAAAEGLKPGEFLEQLKENEDPRWVMYEISKRIHANLVAMRKQLARMREGTRKRDLEDKVDAAEVAATRATDERKQEGHFGESDRAEQLAPEQRTDELRRGLEAAGADPDEAREIAVSHVQQNIKYIFQEAGYQGPSFFSVASKGGSIILTVNRDHPVAKFLLDLLANAENDQSNRALVALKLMLCAWARLEDETQNDRQRQKYVDTRDEWGRMTREFLASAYAED